MNPLILNDVVPNPITKVTHISSSAWIHQQGAFFNGVGRHLGIKHSKWSIYEVVDFTFVPNPSIRIIHYEPSDRILKIEYHRELTYADLWRAADYLIGLSGDNHHIFIENFTVDSTQPDVANLVCGS